MADRTPHMNGPLINSATRLTVIGSGEINQADKPAVPYGRRWYYEEAKFNEAPRRGTHWFTKMLDSGGRQAILKGARRESGASNDD